MKSVINIRLIAIAVTAVLITMIVMTYEFYDVYQQQVQNDLKSDAEILERTIVKGYEKAELSRIHARTLRVTWVGEDGQVLFDNDVDAGKMANHLERPEIADALRFGEGESARRSETLKRNTYYYAVRMDDGTVLRVAREADSIYSFLSNAFPVLIVILVLMIIFCVVIANFMTRSIIRPIEKLAANLDTAAPDYTYKELVPIIDTIREQHEDILRASIMRRDFTANISHELKTPLTAISGYADLMENGLVEESQMREFAEKINKNSNQLLSLIEDVLRLSQLDATDQLPVMEYFDLLAEADQCVDGIRDYAQQNNVSISCSGQNTMIHGNRNMIGELINNLCVNAIRYNKKNGQVTVRVETISNHPVLTVEDTGIGIAVEDQSRIFERFYRVDKSRSKKGGGTGLGLAIVKHITDLHDASLVLTSQLGEGTTIQVFF